MSSKCLICNEENPENSHFWKMHKIKEADYYMQYMPRFDLLTKELIVFKNRDSYLLTDFNNKNNLKKWLNSHSTTEQTHYLKGVLLRRREIKGIKYTPTQVELRSYESCPGIVKFNQLFGDYYKICKDIGFEDRGFVNMDKKTILKRERDLRGNPILVDSREQKMINWGKKEIQITTLPYGDYCLKNDNYGIYFERKELSDFISSHSQGFERLKNEIKRAQLNNDYIIMMVESSLSDAMSFEYLPHISKKIQATSSFIMHRCRELIQEFPNYQVCFTKGRVDLVEKMRFIMEFGQNARNIDWELASNLQLLREGI